VPDIVTFQLKSQFCLGLQSLSLFVRVLPVIVTDPFHVCLVAMKQQIIVLSWLYKKQNSSITKQKKASLQLQLNA